MGIVKHGYYKHPLYSIWNTMVNRCVNPECYSYMWYGALGVKVCERWMNVSNFIEDMEAGWQKGLQLDRIDSSGNYEPANCRWASPSVNSKNRRIKCSKQSDVPYVSYDSHKDLWRYVKYFKTQEEAEAFANG